jgi:prepilin-type N-terminal cleavage/methylation domain-containing protein
MPADRAVVAPQPAPPWTHRAAAAGRRASGDGGFSLIEVLVSIAVIGTVMAAVAPFLVQSLAVSSRQRSAQVGIQVANDALERVRALDPSSLLTGRSELATTAQWQAAPAVLREHLNGMQRTADPMLALTATSGSQAPLPTVPFVVAVNGIDYAQSWYVGLCWQAKAVSAQPAIGDCTATAALVPFFRVLVAVTWQHRSCPAGTCIYVASTLVSKGTDPVFDTKRPPPTITDPGNQTTDVATAVDYQITSAGGRLPLTWSVTGLPPGLSMSTSARITGTPTTVGSYAVVVKVTDRDGRTDDTSFTWTIIAALTLTNPGTQTSPTGTALTLSVPRTGGIAPLVWTANGLPDGLTINASSGTVSGTPTTTQTATSTITVTDAGKPARTASVSFSWQINGPMQIDNPSPVTVKNGTNPGSFAPYGFGGQRPYEWRAENLPPGVTMSSTGSLNGNVAYGTRYVATVWATDRNGDQAKVSVVFDVTPSSSTDLQVTTPDPSSPDRSTQLHQTVSLAAAAAGASSASYAWTAAGLPPGLTVSPAGLISGTPTARGRYLVTLTVKSTGTTEANLMFTWSVT